MKDYSLNKKDAKNFILNYEVKDKQIIINYANGEIKIKPYSKQEEIALLHNMKMQVLRSDNFRTSLYNKYEALLRWIINELFLLVLFIIAIANFNVPIEIVLGGAVLFPVVISITVRKVFDCNKVRNDLKKQVLFIGNDRRLNPIIRSDLEVTKGLDKELKEKVLLSKDESLPFTLNTIENIEYSELEKVYNHVEQFIDNDKPKVLRKIK